VEKINQRNNRNKLMKQKKMKETKKSIKETKKSIKEATETHLNSCNSIRN